MERFRDRHHAGVLLAGQLDQFTCDPNSLILALPRGGVVLGYEIARALHVPLDFCIVRKLSAPGQPELAMGAISTGGVVVLNQDVIANLAISQHEIDCEIAEEAKELARRETLYRAGRSALEVAGKIILLVDDGIATGATIQAAIQAIRAGGAAKIVVAVPVAAQASLIAIAPQVDEVVCLLKPKVLFSVGDWYEDFHQTTDSELHELMDRLGTETILP